MQALPSHPLLLGWPCWPPCWTWDGKMVSVLGAWWWSRREKIFPQVTDCLFIPQCLLLPLPKTPLKFPWPFIGSSHLLSTFHLGSQSCQPIAFILDLGVRSLN